MAFHELYFTFPQKLTKEQEEIFVAFIQRIRKEQVLDKLALARAQAKIQVKIPLNPTKPILEGMITQFDMIESNIDNLFSLEPVVSDTSKYVLRISDSINVNKSNKVERIFKAVSDKRVLDIFIKKTGVKSIKVGGVE